MVMQLSLDGNLGLGSSQAASLSPWPQSSPKTIGEGGRVQVMRLSCGEATPDVRRTRGGLRRGSSCYFLTFDGAVPRNL